MAIRLYVSKLIGDGLTLETAYRPAWRDVLVPAPVQAGGAIESERYWFWIGQLDTDDAQHAALVADSRVRYASQALLATPLGSLTAAQRTAVLEVVTWLGFPTDIWSAANARVADILFYAVGRACWAAASQIAEA